MDRQDISDRIIAGISPEEWEMLETGDTEVPVSEHNRKTLLKLKNTYLDFEGEADEAEVEAFKKSLECFLKDRWPEDKEAHKYVISSCLALKYLFRLPLHPQDQAGWYSEVSDGEAKYFCPLYEEGTVCDSCECSDMDDLTRKWADITDNTRDEWGDESALIQSDILRAGFLESGVIKVSDLKVYQDVRDLCAENTCRHYGRTWACPPAVGTVEECIERVKQYDYMQIFSKAYRLSDDMDFEGMMEALKDFKDCVLKLAEVLRGPMDDVMILSNESCNVCSSCAYPDSPCRFPDRMFHSIEGYGFNVSELAGMAGINYINGVPTVSYFGAVVY
ncbi:MAG: DUF2284 domain-containing protein [Christensenellaceae bacterium]|nr:DUF2284 domain-containing protein [Christensenellaceae bacterium]